MTKSTSDDQLTVRLGLFALSASPDVLPWLGFWIFAWIASLADVGKEIFAGDSLHRLFVMRGHLKLGQCNRRAKRPYQPRKPVALISRTCVCEGF
jgi:hypothetical protein